ncbi:unnamed protein product [Paramecium octaurelia]|uniref:Transmembrane protein n=1 Tax=Paramecium octaurelia TaxID=43137 RepID=A0A8S1TMW3_PAROT|nr:unnamed protein product [Paramecium octaurelia]
MKKNRNQKSQAYINKQFHSEFYFQYLNMSCNLRMKIHRRSNRNNDIQNKMFEQRIRMYQSKVLIVLSYKDMYSSYPNIYLKGRKYKQQMLDSNPNKIYYKLKIMREQTLAFCISNIIIMTFTFTFSFTIQLSQLQIIALCTLC